MAREEKLRTECTVTDRRPPCTGRHLTAGVENEVRWAHQRTGMDSQPDDRLRKGTALGLLVPGPAEGFEVWNRKLDLTSTVTN